jgi:hypothetical protein
MAVAIPAPHISNGQSVYEVGYSEMTSHSPCFTVFSRLHPERSNQLIEEAAASIFA